MYHTDRSIHDLARHKLCHFLAQQCVGLSDIISLQLYTGWSLYIMYMIVKDMSISLSADSEVRQAVI